jgi:hypothetical protein
LRRMQVGVRRNTNQNHALGPGTYLATICTAPLAKRVDIGPLPSYMNCNYRIYKDVLFMLSIGCE